MFCSVSDDCLNAAVANCVTRNQFEEILTFLHVEDNTALDMQEKFSKMRPLLDGLNRQSLDNYLFEQTLSIDESFRTLASMVASMVPSIFGYKMWVIATPGVYAIQFYLYQGAGTSDNVLGLGGNLISCLPHQHGSMYHIVFDNFFTSFCLLQHLSENGFAGTRTLQNNRCKKAPLKEVKEMEKLLRGSFDVVLITKSNTSVSRWKDSKVVTVASTFVEARSLAKATRYNRAKRRKIELK